MPATVYRTWGFSESPNELLVGQVFDEEAGRFNHALHNLGQWPTVFPDKAAAEEAVLKSAHADYAMWNLPGVKGNSLAVCKAAYKIHEF